ncbi:hypothetical protein ADL00_03985 [Streptomyces sp. AS58]|uniref:hypothetical protein n=1 Tax=Streptomyces sp. AS58 TaxID=1519489 RepID=UPI0006AE8D38|nr:hypothetical protein [Streptomyces sp. AS58]KOV73747.1 hypothetical protein ADL00_03985 [Streptomyces sp. AS58]
MTAEQATVIAALIGVVGGLAGVCIGRWQVRDEAVVEHEQWLRGQRQEAYTALLAAWDASILKLIDLLPSDDEHWAHLEATYEGDLIEATEESIWNRSLKIKGDLDQPLERVQLLGPNIVDAACVVLASTAETVVQTVRQVRFPLNEAAIEELDELRDRADAARTKFFNAARQVIHTPPSPRRRMWAFGADSAQQEGP